MSQTMIMRLSAGLIVLLTILGALVVMVADYLAGKDIPTLIYAILSSAFTTALGYLFLDKGVTLTNSPTTDVLKQASAAIVATANALPTPTPAPVTPAPSDAGSNV